MIPEEKKTTGNILKNEDGNISHSYRHYSPSYFNKMADKAETRREKGMVRATWKFVEDGRFYKAIDAVHRMVYKLDPDERKSFLKSNKRMATWLDVHAGIMGAEKF